MTLDTDVAVEDAVALMTRRQPARLPVTAEPGSSASSPGATWPSLWLPALPGSTPEGAAPAARAPSRLPGCHKTGDRPVSRRVERRGTGRNRSPEPEREGERRGP